MPKEFAGGNAFALRVRGDSMIEEGSASGDYVVVERRAVARNGETVVALIRGEEATLKMFRQEGRWSRSSPRIPPSN